MWIKEKIIKSKKDSPFWTLKKGESFLWSQGFVKTKKIVTIALLLAVVVTTIVVLPSLTQASWFSSGGGAGRVWNYRQKVVINHKLVSQVNGTTLVNFPVLVSIPANALTTSMNNGGHVGLDTGYDIVFTSGDGKTKLAHEIESYASTTGAIIAWVKIPSLSSKTDTTIYMYYGNASETGNEQNATGVWDSNYVGVYHLGESTGASGYKDSTITNNPFVHGATDPTAAIGLVDGAQLFNNKVIYLNSSTPINFDYSNPFTISTWIYPTNFGADRLFLGTQSGSTGYAFGTKITTGLLYFNLTGSYQVQSSQSLSLNTWNNIVVTYNGSGNRTGVKLYVNTVATVGSGAMLGSMASSTAPFYMWRASYNNNTTFDETHISNSARTPDWIKTEYNNQSSPSTFETFGAEETQPSAQINGGWYNAAWSYRKKITIPHSQVSGTSTLSNFPVLISTTQQILSYTSFGGHTASSTGGDILFTMADGKTPLNYEIESYASTTGQLLAWVQIPSLSPTADNTIYMYYGNASAPTVPATTAQNVWSNGYAGVYHLGNGTTLSAIDSTNQMNGSIQGSPTAVSSPLGGGMYTTSTSNYISLGNSFSNTTHSQVTLSAWVKFDAYNAVNGIMGVDIGGGNYIDQLLYWNTIIQRIANASSNNVAASKTAPATGSWHYLIGAYDGSNVIVYVDGVAGTPAAQTGNIINTATGMVIGRNPSYSLNGSIAEARISSTARIPSWIATEYQNQSAPSTFETIAGEETQAVTTFNSTWYSSAWGYRKPIVIDHRKINRATGTTTPLTNFPVLISVTDPSLASVSSGGYMASTSAADLLFTDSTGKNKLNHEIESYNSATGQLLAWVQIPTLPSTVDTTVYMYFGNGAATSQQSVAATWDSTFAGVWHLPNGTTLTANDSTSNGNTGSISSGITAGVGQIDGAAVYPVGNTTKTITVTNSASLRIAAPYSLSIWFNIPNSSAQIEQLLGKDSSNTMGLGYSPSTQKLYGYYSGVGAFEIDTGSTAITAGVWHHAVLSIPSANSENLYVDGQLIASSTAANSASFLASLDTLIGGNLHFTYPIVNGKVDEARISSTARTADWIKTEYLNQSSPSTFFAKGGLQTQNHTSQQSNEQITNRGWYNNKALGVWNYRMPITISHNMVGSSTTATLSNFPVLVSVTNPSLRSVSNSGFVASTSGADILFTDSDGGIKLPHEIESYDAVNGILVAWVKVPILSTTIDHTIYIYYGNSTANLLSQQNPTAVWDSNYAGVWHLGNGTTLSANDSTSNGYNGTATAGMAAGAGKIGGGAKYPVSNTIDNIVIPDRAGLHISQPLTTSIWFNIPSTGSSVIQVVFSKNYYVSYSPAIDYNGYYQWVGSSDSAATGWNTYPTVYSAGAWHYVSVTQTGGHTYIYIDGSLVKDMTDGGSPNYLTLAYNMIIGGDNGAFTAPIINGTTDEARISNIDRTADWITTEYLNQSAPGSYVTLGAQQTSGTATQTTNWYNASWTNRRTITIDHRKVSTVSGTSLVNFPMLFSTTDNEFKMPSGKVKENHGYDFVFTDSDGKTILNSEIETYASSTGQLIAWVKIPNLSPTQDKVIYLYYGNASATAPSSAFTQGVWSNGYAGVWHLPNGTTLTANDSTGVNNSSVGTGITAGTGQIDGGASYPVANANAITVTNSASLRITYPYTLSIWFNIPNSNGNSQQLLGKGDTTSNMGIRYAPSTQALFIQSLDPHVKATTGVWHYAVYSNTSNSENLYVDGKLAFTDAFPIDYSASNNTLIGGNSNLSYPVVNGKLDEARISSTVRTADWIKTEYLNQLFPSKFYALSVAGSSQTRPASTPLLKSRGGVQFH